MSHLTFLHTAEMNAAVLGGLMAELAPDIEVRHVLHSEYLDEAIRDGAISAELVERVRSSMREAAAGGASVVVCSCSTIGGAGEFEDEAAGAKFMRIDRAMAERAVAAGSRIGVAACLESTVGPTTALIRKVAAEAGKDIEIRTILLAGAWAKFKAGDAEGYISDIVAGLRRSSNGLEAIVLAQASMARAAVCGELGIPVLSSPRLGVESAIAAFRAGQV